MSEDLQLALFEDTSAQYREIGQAVMDLNMAISRLYAVHLARELDSGSGPGGDEAGQTHGKKSTH